MFKVINFYFKLIYMVVLWLMLQVKVLEYIRKLMFVDIFYGYV